MDDAVQRTFQAVINAVKFESSIMQTSFMTLSRTIIMTDEMLADADAN